MKSDRNCGSNKKRRRGACGGRAGKILSLMLALLMCLTCVSCGKNAAGSAGERKDFSGMTAEEIVASMTIEQKASQMVQSACYDLDKGDMRANCYGSILSTDDPMDYKGWQARVDGYQEEALTSEAGIPYIYGADDVHGVYSCTGAVIFPHSIGLGAADDEELMYEMGRITADEAKLCHMIWNYSPVLAVSVDPRWGRTYESYSSNTDKIRRLSTSYTRGLVDGGLIVCAKHYIGDGNVVFGTGEDSDVDRLIDRGDARMSDEEIREQYDLYCAEMDAGAQTIMLSHSSVNGVKMHENKELIMMLKERMGPDRFIVSDWDSVQNTSPGTYYEQIVTAVNSGVDMLMEVGRTDEARDIIVEAVKNGDIDESRVDDAVTRIIRVKMNAGVFDDPLFESVETVQQEPGSREYRDVAEKLVEESLVLLKNDGNILPLKKGSKVLIMGPAADNDQAQCGGWTLLWNSSPEKDISGVTSIKEGFAQKADDYGITVLTDESKIDQADVIVLVVGEQSYAEWNGDTEDLDLCRGLALDGNKAALDKAAASGKPVVTCIVAGRHVFIDKYIDQWDAAVMCYLPGSEGQGVADVLCGGTDFRGKLPSPWYNSTEQIGTDDAWLEEGYGLTMGI